jgi:hypothetical protein
MNITVVEHDPNWKYEYLNEEYLIKEIIQKELVNISFTLEVLLSKT